MNELRKLLVIINPDVRDDYVLDRARRLAHAFRPEIELVTRKNNMDEALSALSEAEVPITPHIREERPDHEAILQRIQKYQPDMVLKSVRRRHPLARLLVTSTDWKLVRHSPAPLWLVKSRDWHTDGSIMAAVDPLHSKAQQNELDHLLLESTSALASRLELQARIFHCYFPDVTSMFPKVLDAGSYLREKRAKHEQKMMELLKPHHLDMDNVLMTRGDLGRTLAQAIRKERTNLLVLGALSRNVVEHAIIGSTTERMLSDARCDVLVMKSQRQQHIR